jgi:2-iminoacetate synthase
MSFISEFDQLDLTGLTSFAENATGATVEAALARSTAEVRRTSGTLLADFAALVSPKAAEPQYLEEMAQLSHRLSLKHFGRVIRLFAPIYLSNECINVCKYCGFSRDNPILRVTLTLEQVKAEAEFLREQGFRHVLLVAGEHPHFVSVKHLCQYVTMLHKDWPSISLEVGPMETDEYRDCVQAGAEGLTIYQETYNRVVYDKMHVSGPKKDFTWRLETPERAAAAGFKRVGIGALLGLAPWRSEVIALTSHANYLLRHCWRSQLTLSIPRIRPAAGEFQPLVHVGDRDLVQLVCALRLTLPEVGIVLSTRESPKLRDGLIPLGVTMMSAGSHTEPGGYTGQGKEGLHFTKGGRAIKRIVPLVESEGEQATVQFEIADNRTPIEVAARLESMGYEPVWKDWEAVLSEG